VVQLVLLERKATSTTGLKWETGSAGAQEYKVLLEQLDY
jgi:hypothetical protein